MTIANEPQDLLGLAVNSLLTPYLKEKKFQNKIRNWKRKIVIEIKNMYPISVIFNKGIIKIEYDEIPKYDLKIILSLKAFTEIAEGKSGMISAFLKGEIKIKKLYRIFTVLKFKNIFIPALKNAVMNKETN